MGAFAYLPYKRLFFLDLHLNKESSSVSVSKTGFFTTIGVFY